MRKVVRGSLVPVVLCLVACSQNGREGPKQAERPAPSPPIAPTAAQIDPSTAGSISGRVAFRGRRPSLPTIDFSSNPQCERAHAKPVKAETVVVNKNGTLRNTLVWISGGLPEMRWEPPAVPAKLDQFGCVYQPHVLALMTGQELQVLNSDLVNHNVHAEAAVNPATTQMEPPRSDTVRKRFRDPEIWIPFTCSVHPWMRAYVAVINHPFFAVTGDDGSFEIAGIPPGTYTVETVHEKYGRKTKSMTIGARERKTVDFEYAE